MPAVVALVDDLMFLSRIREAARASGAEVRGARDAASAVEAVRSGGRLVLMDLDSARLPWAEALSAIRADPALADVRVVGFFSHVHAERARSALAAGCTQALPRSVFVNELPGLLAGA
jgi:CheY-like chemotaxis protein